MIFSKRKDMKDKEIIEAVLFAAGGAVDAQTLAKVVNKTAKTVKPVVQELMEEYSTRETGMEIIDLGGRYVMQVKAEYTDLVSPVAPKELRSPILRTLSMIAYHQPVVQAELVDMRGNSAYDHIRELKERGLIEAVPHGRTKLLQTTHLFADYFGLTSNDPESIKKKIVELSRQQGGSEGLDRWLGRKFVGLTPMYSSLADLCGIKDYRVINAYDPTEEELESLADVVKMVISKGYEEKVSRYYDGEIIEVSSTTFGDIIDAINALESVADPDRAKESIELIEDLRERYVSKALVISRKVKPATDMIARIVSDLRLGVSAEGCVVAPDYGTSSDGVDISEGADILVPTHSKVEGDLVDRVCKKYDAIIDGLKNLEK
ncbi:Segregation and condensation protein B [Methanococcoides methylutens MM1]|uniref:Segregation and condensation protein B n=2 Tax=Methanococcoides methylutens TaxID=2226 RepID=A0A0E3X0U4_METMT|nr:Segregation and condensation protein B [Methanococcoides methylutens MM1]